MKARIAVALVVTGCSVALADPAGRACDETHGCREGRVCVAGTCTSPSAASTVPTRSDAGPDAEAPAPVTCTHVVAPTGSDDAPGTPEAPFRTLERLTRQLAPGVVGCLRAGTYAADLVVTRGGAPGSPAVVRSAPGERAKLEGRLLLTETATFVTLAALDIDGTNALGDSGPVVLATDVTIEDSDLTSRNKDGCLRLGDPAGALASRALVQRNRIHDCGVAVTNSASGVKIANGAGIRVVGNVIWGNKDHGVLLYPSAQASTVRGNVLDGNGRSIVLGGTDTQTSNDNVVEGNVMTFPVTGENVAAFFDAKAVGRNNVVRRNCLFGGVVVAGSGLTESEDVVADPAYADRAAHDYRVGAGSPCAALLGKP